jgi:hypothetical protein
MKNAAIKPGAWYYYGFSIYIPTDWIYDSKPEILFQWKGGKGGKPFMSLHSKYSDFNLVINTSPDPEINARQDKDSLARRTYEITENFELGKWHDFLFNVTWDFNPSGVAKLFVEYKTEDQDEYTTVVKDYEPNMYNVEGYAKWGVYKPVWKKNPDKSQVTMREVWHDNIRIGYMRDVVDPSIKR